MQYKAFEDGIEVNGRTIYTIVDGFRTIKFVPSTILVKQGVGTLMGGGIKIDDYAWYSQQAWLNAFQEIAASMGQDILFKIGQKIPENAEFPPWVNDIDSAIKSIDIAYHMNHRRNGIVMFNPDTGVMMEGIGHYGYERVAGQKRILSCCNNPYPCDFDHGIITAMATRFEARAQVRHQPGSCRKEGADACTYQIEW